MPVPCIKRIPTETRKLHSSCTHKHRKYSNDCESKALLFRFFHALNNFRCFFGNGFRIKGTGGSRIIRFQQQQQFIISKAQSQLYTQILATSGTKDTASRSNSSGSKGSMMTFGSAERRPAQKRIMLAGVGVLRPFSLTRHTERRCLRYDGDCIPFRRSR